MSLGNNIRFIGGHSLYYRNTLIDSQALDHYNRVIADGGQVPGGLMGVVTFFVTIKSIFNVTNITDAIYAGFDPQILGFKMGSGSGSTANQAINKLYSATGSAYDLQQSTAANQPLLLLYNNSNYFYCSGIRGNFCNSNNTAWPTAEGGTFIVKYSTNVNNQTGSIFAKDNDITIRAWLIQIQANRSLTFFFGTKYNFITNSVSTLSADFDGYIKIVATTVSADMIVQFYYSSDGITYTQLGTDKTVLGAANSINTGSSGIQLGCNGPGGGNPFSGKIYNAWAYDSNNNLVFTFSPDQFNRAVSQTTWTTTSGQIMTINIDSAASGYKGALVSRTLIMGDGSNDTMSTGTFSAIATLTRYVVFNPFTSASTVYVVDGNIQDRHSLYTSTTARFYNSGTGAGEVVTTITDDIIQLVTGTYNGAGSSAQTNNGTETTGTVGNNSNTAIQLFSNAGATLFFNGIVSSFIEAIVSDSTQKTGVYNYLKTINPGI